MSSRVSALVPNLVAAVTVAAVAVALSAVLNAGSPATAAFAPRPAAVAAPVDGNDTVDTVDTVDTDDRPTRPTINEFFPEERPLSDCLSSLPKPNCGSEARGGWRQLAVLGAILGGLGFIAWRIVAAARRARPERAV